MGLMQCIESAHELLLALFGLPALVVHRAPSVTLALKAALCLRLDLMGIDFSRFGLLSGHFYGKKFRLVNG